MSELENGKLLGHTACPDCGGSDPLALYDKGDYVNGWCWSNCGLFKAEQLKELDITDGKKEVLADFAIKASGKSFIMTDQMIAHVKSIGEKYQSHGWPERRIPAIVNKFYGVVSEVEGKGRDKVMLKEYCPSYDQEDKLVGYHVRDDAVKQARNRGEKTDKPPFWPIGKVRSDCKMFGQNKFEKGGKYLVLASGQADARAIFTAMNTETFHEGGKKRIAIKKFLTPVVSVTTGESSLSQIKANYEYISSFENVVIMYDTDDAGKEGAEKIAKLLRPSQAKIAKYERKDACDHSSRGEWDKITKAFWKAESYSPIDIVSLGSLWDEFEKAVDDDIVELPHEYRTLAEMLGGGYALGEVTVFGALTSVGKSTHINKLAYDAAYNKNKKVGLVYLESSPKEIVQGMLSIYMEQNLALQRRNELNMEALRIQFKDMIGTDNNIITVNHHGSFRSTEELFDKIRWLIKAAGCEIVIIDPLQAAIPSNENSVIDDFMDSCLKIAKETNAAIHIVSHMKKPADDKPHDVSEYDLKGCVDKDTEFLTDNGWIKISEWSGENVAEFNMETKSVQFQQPLDYIKLPCDKFIHFNTIRGMDMMLSEEHRVVFRHANLEKLQFIEASEMLKKHNESTVGYRGRIPTTFDGVTGREGMGYSEIDLRMAVAFQADGHQRKDLRKGYVTFAFKKERKIERMEKLIKQGGYKHSKPFVSTGGVWYVRVHIPLSDKIFDEKWWDASKEDMEVIMDELKYWDYYKVGRSYSTTIKQNADYIQYVLTANGKRSRIYEQVKEAHQNIVYVVREASNDTVCLANKDGRIDVGYVPSVDGFKYCFTTSTGAWVARRNGQVFITGNSSSINQVAFNTILMSRDKTHPDARVRNATKFTLVKCRRTGITGGAGWLKYEPHSVKITEIPDPYDSLDEPDDDMLDLEFAQKTIETEDYEPKQEPVGEQGF